MTQHTIAPQQQHMTTEQQQHQPQEQQKMCQQGPLLLALHSQQCSMSRALQQTRQNSSLWLLASVVKQHAQQGQLQAADQQAAITAGVLYTLWISCLANN
jgi:hypothetical protein